MTHVWEGYLAVHISEDHIPFFLKLFLKTVIRTYHRSDNDQSKVNGNPIHHFD
jgi:hypothetical protein